MISYYLFTVYSKPAFGIPYSGFGRMEITARELSQSSTFKKEFPEDVRLLSKLGDEKLVMERSRDDNPGWWHVLRSKP